MKNIIIHFPFKIDRTRMAASQLRPAKIISTFESLGYNVDVVEGYGKERRKKIKEVKRAIEEGKKYDFMYSECSTIPTLLTEKHHYPIFPFLDFSFFGYCKKNNIPIGLFYRDIYWCFPENRRGIRDYIVNLFYKYDLKKYNQTLSVLFVPSFEMLQYVHTNINVPSAELYPGCDKKIIKENCERDSRCINILYVGGVGFHYDLRLFLSAVKDNLNVRFTLCCRVDDWDEVKDDYSDYIGDNVRIVHASGKELEKLYSEADLFCLYVEPNKYREFAVPFKLFETIGYGCPILASNGTWVAKFVEKNKIGYVCDYHADAIKKLLEHLQEDPDTLVDYKKNIIQIADSHTWAARCMQIEKALMRSIEK